MDSEIRKESAKIFKKQGFKLRTSTKVTGAERSGEIVRLTVEPSQGSAAETIEADVVLVSIGRRPNADGLALEAAGLLVNKKGQIDVDHEFRTGVAGIYAIGDVTPGPMLAHKAEDEGVAVAEIIAGQVGIINHDLIPSVVYTYPEIAAVGKTEDELKENGVDYKVGKFPMMANSRAKTNRDTEGLVKIIADARTDRVLGVHIIASVAGTMIAQAVQAMEFGATSEDIAYTCHAHPTHSEAMKEAAMAVTGQAIHI
jgi:dihydrolipoamide dehydrogenase